MGAPIAKRPEFDAYVAARWPRLLRVAYLLTVDWSTAEDLVQTALVKAWFAWRRIGGDPEPYIRRIIVTSYLSGRRRRWRAVIVLRYFEDLPEAQIAALLGVAAGTVKSQASKALATLRLDESLRPDQLVNGRLVNGGPGADH